MRVTIFLLLSSLISWSSLDAWECCPLYAALALCMGWYFLYRGWKAMKEESVSGTQKGETE